MKTSPFATLVRAFLGRFFDNEMTGGSNDLKASFIWLISFLAAPGLFLPMTMAYRWGTIATVRGPAELQAVAQADVVLFIGFAMIATGVVTALVWNALMLDHRDGVILGAMPLKSSTIVRAKLTALVCYVATTAVATNAIASVVFGFWLAQGSTFAFALHNTAAMFATCSAACALVFAAVVAAQGTLLVTLGPKRFSRLSPILQSALVGVILLCLLALPTVSESVVSTLQGGLTLQFNWESLTPKGLIETTTGPVRLWIANTPPLWFLGMYEWLLGSRDPFFALMAVRALAACAGALALTALTYPLAYRRVMRSVVEQAAGFGRIGRISAAVRLLTVCISRSGEVRAIAAFFLTTIARVERHRLVIAVGFGAAFAWAAPTLLMLSHTNVPALDSRLAGLSLGAVTLIVAALRVAASLPSDLRCAWLFDVYRPSRLQAHQALERTMFAIGVAPIALVSSAWFWRWFGLTVAALHLMFTLAAGLFLIELLLRGFHDVPSATPWRPERANLRKWWPLYLMGFLFFAQALPTLEGVLLRPPTFDGIQTSSQIPVIGLTWFLSCLLILTIAVRRASLKAPIDVDDNSLELIAFALHSKRGHVRDHVGDDAATLRGTERMNTFGRGSMFGSSDEAHVSLASRLHDLGTELIAVPGHLPRDVYSAVHRLRRGFGFTCFAVATLALSIGATTAVYSLIYNMIGRDLGIRDANRVIAVSQSSTRGNYLASLSWPDYQDLLASQTSLGSVSGWSGFPTSLTVDGATTLVHGEGVSGGGFDVLHVSIALGRPIAIDDDRPDAAPVAVLSDEVWRAQFGADPHAVGRVIKLGSRLFDVIGVAPGSFRGVSAHAFERPSVWIPLASVPPMLQAAGYPLDASNRRQSWLTAIGRIKDSVRADRTSIEIVRIGKQLDEAEPLAAGATQVTNPNSFKRRWYAAPVIEMLSPPLAAQYTGWAFVAVPGLVLLVACTNLANLILSRGAARRHEMAIRQALGNSRGGVIRELLVEHGLIALIGAGAGLVVASRLLVWVAGVAQDAFGYEARYRIDAHLEPAVVLAALVTAVVALVISGLMPAIQLTRGGAKRVIDGHANLASPRWRGRSWLIAGQVAVSVALLFISAFFVRVLMSDNRGAAPQGLEQVAVVNVSFGLQQRTEAQARHALDSVLQELQSAGGIRVAAVTSMSGPRVSAQSQVETATVDRPFGRDVNWDNTRAIIATTPGLWRTLDLPMRSGRALTDDDIAFGTVAVLDETAARRIFGTPDAVGRSLLLRSATLGGPRNLVETRTVVGIAKDSAITNGGQAQSDGVIYVPFSQRYESNVAIFARPSTGDVSAAVGAIRTALRHADPELAVSAAGRADVVASWGPGIALGLMTRFAITLACLALGLAMAGLYGVLSHVVSRRTRELGIRLALGAEPSALTRMIMIDGLRPVIQGLVIGIALSLLLRAVLQAQGFKALSPLDFLAFAVALVPLVAASLVSSYVPARRASLISPNAALKES